MNNLYYTTAERHVDFFKGVMLQHKDVMEQHREAMDCFDCEAFLQIGIDAFHWLIRADRALRRLICRGQERVEVRDESILLQPLVDEMIPKLFEGWLKPCREAHEWVDRQIQRGFTVDNLKKFEECERQVRSIVKSLHKDEMTDAIRGLRDDALMDHRNGETAEFV